MNALDADLIIHDINSQCVSLKSAAEMIENLPVHEADLLLELMAVQTKRLTFNIAHYRKKRGLVK